MGALTPAKSKAELPHDEERIVIEIGPYKFLGYASQEIPIVHHTSGPKGRSKRYILQANLKGLQVVGA